MVRDYFFQAASSPARRLGSLCSSAVPLSWIRQIVSFLYTYIHIHIHIYIYIFLFSLFSAERNVRGLYHVEKVNKVRATLIKFVMACALCLE